LIKHIQDMKNIYSLYPLPADLQLFCFLISFARASFLLFCLLILIKIASKRHASFAPPLRSKGRRKRQEKKQNCYLFTFAPASSEARARGRRAGGTSTRARDEIFKNLVGTAPRVHTRKPDIRTKKIYQTIAFKSLRYPFFNYYYDLFYKYDTNNKRYKVVPNNIKELLNARALAYWIMDDGGIDAFKATHLNTDAFTLKDVNASSRH
jgi:hypothetical protein